MRERETGVTTSVVLRTYDHGPFIAQAIESVLLQRTQFRFELIVAEDCSTDGTREIVEGYAARNPELIRTVLPERNLGHGEILRRGLQAVRGRYVAYLDGDDYWTSCTKLARQVDFLDRNPECQSCFHDVSLIYDRMGLPSGAVSPRLGERRFGLRQILLACFVPAPSMVFRREVSDGLPAWAFESPWIDWLIHIHAALGGSIGYLPQTLAAYRVHSGGMFSGLDRVSQLEADLSFYERLISEMPAERRTIERCLINRHAQLAIERLGVAYDACVVLVDPSREQSPYFNGRHARHLPRREGREMTELEAIRDSARDLPPAVGDYGPRVDPDARDGACYVVVPRDAEAWLRQRAPLRDYLARHGQVAWESEWVTIHELAPLSATGMARRMHATARVEVNMLVPASGDLAAFLDAPRSGALLPAHAVTVTGWLLAKNGRAAQTIEFEVEEEVVWRAPVNVARADVVAAFPEASVERCGFQSTLNVQELPADATVELTAVFADDARVRFATLRLMAAIAEVGKAADEGAGAGTETGAAVEAGPDTTAKEADETGHV